MEGGERNYVHLDIMCGSGLRSNHSQNMVLNWLNEISSLMTMIVQKFARVSPHTPVAHQYPSLEFILSLYCTFGLN
jgi:hypothetical protein